MDAIQAKAKILLNLYPQFLDGFSVTIGVVVYAIIFTAIFSLVLTAIRWFSKGWLSVVLTAYVDFMRNTPLLLQMFLLYFGLPLMGWRLDGFYCGVLAMSLQHSAFFADTLRAGLESVSQRQREAATALGMSTWQALRYIVLPQAVIRTVPAQGNQVMILIKDSSIVSGIGVLDLTLTGKVLLERTSASFEVFIVIATFYLILTTIAGLVLRYVEARLQPRME